MTWGWETELGFDFLGEIVFSVADFPLFGVRVDHLEFREAVQKTQWSFFFFFKLVIARMPPVPAAKQAQ